MSVKSALDFATEMRAAAGYPPDTEVTDTQLITLFNECVCEYIGEIGSQYFNELVTYEDLSFTSGDTAKELTTTGMIIQVYSCEDRTSKNLLQTMDYGDYILLINADETAPTAKPQNWAIWGVGDNDRPNIVLYPTSDASYTIRVRMMVFDDLVLSPSPTVLPFTRRHEVAISRLANAQARALFTENKNVSVLERLATKAEKRIKNLPPQSSEIIYNLESAVARELGVYR